MLIYTIFRPPYWCISDMHQHGISILSSDKLLYMTRRNSNEETSREQVSLRQKPHNYTKNSNIETTYLDRHLCFPQCTATKLNYRERSPRQKHRVPKHRCPYPKCEYQTEDVKDELAALYFLRSTQMAHTCKPPVSPLHKQRLSWESVATFHIVCRIARRVVLLPYPLERLGRSLKIQRQRHGHTTAQMLWGTALKRPHKECTQFPHQQIHGWGDDSDQKTYHGKWKHYACSCTAPQLESRPEKTIRSFSAHLRSQSVNSLSNVLAAIQNLMKN